MTAAAPTVCILAAGRGTRIGAFGGKLHKALLPLGNRAVLSHIIGQFPAGTRFVIALGHLDDQVRDYLALVHPDVDATLVRVENVDGPGSGPGHSLSCCRPALPGPFVFTSCDTLVNGPLPATAGNWIGVCRAEHPERWCTAECDDGSHVVRLHDKSADGSPLAFIGIAGVADPDRFWPALGTPGAAGEAQVVPGLEALIPAGLAAVELPWLDTGTDATYRTALERFAKNYTFDGKTTDVTYRHGDVIVKFSFDPAVSARRYERGAANRGVFAPVLACRGHAYSYRFVEGPLLSAGLDGPACRRVLDWLEARFWRPVTDHDGAAFRTTCRRFYDDKTRERLAAYRALYQPGGEEETLVLNGRPCPPVHRLLDALPAAVWDEAIPSTFHGDLHADNVIVSGDGYILIDWRHDFGGLVTVGDRYYDLAKFFHTLDLSVAAMDAGAYGAAPDGGGGLILSHQDSEDLAAARQAFIAFAAAAGYDATRIAIINALVFINMAPLYDRDMGDYLYRLGRLRLVQALAGEALNL